jgi:hypothetical protein
MTMEKSPRVDLRVVASMLGYRDVVVEVIV